MVTSVDLAPPLPRYNELTVKPSIGEGDAIESRPMRNWMAGISNVIASILADGQTFALQANRQLRNILYNGAFNVWQRGVTGFTSAAAPVNGPDRWQIFRGVGGATLARITFFSDAIPYLCRMQRTAADASLVDIYLGQSLETIDSVPLAGATVSLSFQAAAGANYSGGVLTAVVRSGTGTDQNIFGAYTGTNDFLTITGTLTGSLQTFSGSAVVPVNCNELGVYFFYTPSGVAGANDYVDFAQVQLEVAPAATPFEYRQFNDELARCQRYFQKSYDYPTAPATIIAFGCVMYRVQIAGVAAGWTQHVRFARPMRVAPTITTYNPAAVGATWFNATAAANSGAAALVNTGDSGINIRNPQVVGDAVGNEIEIHWSADAEL